MTTSRWLRKVRVWVPSVGSNMFNLYVLPFKRGEMTLIFTVDDFYKLFNLVFTSKTEREFIKQHKVFACFNNVRFRIPQKVVKIRSRRYNINKNRMVFANSGLLVSGQKCVVEAGCSAYLQGFGARGDIGS